MRLRPLRFQSLFLLTQQRRNPMALNPLANRKNVRSPKDGNSGVRFQDSTAKVAAIIANAQPLAQSGKRSGGCSGCNK